jgi:hypothetical protein
VHYRDSDLKFYLEDHGPLSHQLPLLVTGVDEQTFLRAAETVVFSFDTDVFADIMAIQWGTQLRINWKREYRTIVNCSELPLD